MNTLTTTQTLRPDFVSLLKVAKCKTPIKIDNILEFVKSNKIYLTLDSLKSYQNFDIRERYKYLFLHKTQKNTDNFEVGIQLTYDRENQDSAGNCLVSDLYVIVNLIADNNDVSYYFSLGNLNLSREVVNGYMREIDRMSRKQQVKDTLTSDLSRFKLNGSNLNLK